MKSLKFEILTHVFYNPSCLSPPRYDPPLSPMQQQHLSSDLGLKMEKRCFFEIPNPHCDLDQYKYQDDFE